MEIIKEILYEYGLSMSFVKERRDYHPEYSLLQHTLTVLDNVEVFKSKELTLAALFHDLGKIDTYQIYKNSYGHEITSAWILGEQHKRIPANVDFDLVWWLVRNHIRAARVVEGLKDRNTKELKAHKGWSLMEAFCEADDMRNDTRKHKEDLLGKRVYVTTNEGQLLAGTCNYIGYNSFFNDKQVTIDRSPVRINNYNQVCSYFNYMAKN